MKLLLNCLSVKCAYCRECSALLKNVPVGKHRNKYYCLDCVRVWLDNKTKGYDNLKAALKAVKAYTPFIKKGDNF